MNTSLKWRTYSMSACTVVVSILALLVAMSGATHVAAQGTLDSSTTTVSETGVSEEKLQETNAVSEEGVNPFEKKYTSEIIEAVGGIVAGDFVVGPGKSDLTIEPGTSKIIELLVTNRTGESRQFNFEVEDTMGSSNIDTPIILLGSETGPYTLKDYIQLPHKSIMLEQNERARIPVTISVPADAEPGGRYGSILVTTVSKDAVKGVPGGTDPASAIISRVGTLFFVTVPGDTKIEGSLQGLALLPHKLFLTKGPVNFQLLFENTGDLHLTPYGEISISNMLEEEVGFIEVEPWFAMPQSLRSREVLWDREFLFGRYVATAQVNRGYDDIIDTQHVVFWVLPWKIVLGAFLGLFVLFLSIRFVLKNFEFKRKPI